MINSLNKLSFYVPGVIHPQSFKHSQVFNANASSVEVSEDPEDRNGNEINVRKAPEDRVKVENNDS